MTLPRAIAVTYAVTAIAFAIVGLIWLGDHLNAPWGALCWLLVPAVLGVAMWSLVRLLDQWVERG